MPRPLVLSASTLRRELSGPEMTPFLDALGDEDLFSDKDAFRQSVDQALEENIRTAQDKFETDLSVFLIQRRIVTAPISPGQERGRDFDMIDNGYDLDAAEWRGGLGVVKLRFRPVVSLQRLTFQFGNGLPNQTRLFENEWVTGKARLGTLNVLAYAGRSAGQAPLAMLPHFALALGGYGSMNGGHTPNIVTVDYTAGLLPRDFNVETDDLDDACPDFPVRSCIDVVKKMAAVATLQSLDDALGAGGGSISMEGLSESYDPQKFAGRQGRYEARIEKEKVALLRKFAPLPMFSK